MSKHLESIAFDLRKCEQEMAAFGQLLKSKADLSERKDIQSFFDQHRQLPALMGTYSTIWLATELAFEFPFFGDHTADLVIGNKAAGEFCVVEFEEGGQDSVFKKQPRRGNPEWSARFEHGVSQLTDWFFHLDDFKGTKSLPRLSVSTTSGFLH